MISILILDDDPNELHILRLLSKNMQIEIDGALDFFTAIEKIREKEYDLFICDALLPGTTGLQVIEEVKRITGNIVIFAHTSMSKIQDSKPPDNWRFNLMEGLKKECDDFLSKPCSLDEFQMLLLKFFPEKYKTVSKK